VVACNTASASALDALRAHHPALPIIGVIEPGAQAAVAASVSQHIAVIATEGTICGGAYQTAIHRLNPCARVTSRACSLFVSMAEEGWTEGPIAEAVARRYLDPIFQRNDAPDTLVLGCTHFPVLAAALRAVLPPQVSIVDSAATTAAAVLHQLHGASGASGARGAVSWLATDGAARFARVGSTFLGETLAAEAVEIIDL
jgi:glutamate racemase